LAECKGDKEGERKRERERERERRILLLILLLLVLLLPAGFIAARSSSATQAEVFFSES
jgi:hypothetical protein